MSWPLALPYDDDFSPQTNDVLLLSSGVISDLCAGDVRSLWMPASETRTGEGMPIAAVEFIHDPRRVADTIDGL